MPDTPAGEAPFDRVMRMRIALAIGLLAPLAFFIFLVLRFEESPILAVGGAAVYLYILGQFFIFQNPKRRARIAVAGQTKQVGTGGLARSEDL